MLSFTFLANLQLQCIIYINKFIKHLKTCHNCHVSFFNLLCFHFISAPLNFPEKSRFKFYNFFYENNFLLGDQLAPLFLFAVVIISFISFSAIFKKKKRKHRRHQIYCVKTLIKKIREYSRNFPCTYLSVECKFSASVEAFCKLFIGVELRKISVSSTILVEDEDFINLVTAGPELSSQVSFSVRLSSVVLLSFRLSVCKLFPFSSSSPEPLGKY